MSNEKRKPGIKKKANKKPPTIPFSWKGEGFGETF